MTQFYKVRILEDRCRPVVTLAHLALLFLVIKCRRCSENLRSKCGAGHRIKGDNNKVIITLDCWSVSTDIDGAPSVLVMVLIFSIIK